MSFSYSGDPSTSDLDATRFRLGDTVSPGHIFEDEEIQYVLDMNGGDVIKSVIDLARIAAAKFVRQADEEEEGEVRVKLLNESKRWLDLADRLEESVGLDLNPPTPFIGANTKQDYKARRCDPTRIPNAFESNSFDNKRVNPHDRARN